MKSLIILVCVGVAFAAPQNPADIPPPTPDYGINGMPMPNSGAYGGYGAYSGLGFSGPYNYRPLHGIRAGSSCGGTELKISETLNQTMKECHDKVWEDWENSGNPGDPPTETKACGIVCTAQGFGLLDKYGKPMNDNIAAHVEKVYPLAFAADITSAVIACGDKYGKDVTIKDGSCSSFEQLVGCVKSSVRRICHVGIPTTKPSTT